VSERGTQVGIARARSAVVAPNVDAAPVVDGMAADDPAAVLGSAAVLESAAVLATLAEVPDPELPMVSIVDLGMIGGIEVDAAMPDAPGTIHVELLPTTDRISETGLAALATAGIAPPAAAPEDLRCPYCGSGRVVMDSAFGPTQCRSLHYCRDCRQPFEAMKPV
jgi:ring-1,2-phenylacetyl-CoA epoxidase subunit PaaD